MLGGDGGAALLGGGEQGPPSQQVRPAPQPPGALVDGGDRLLAQEVCLTADEGEVMGEVLLHVDPLEALPVGAADHPGGERAGGVVQQLVDEGRLAA